MKVDYTNTAKRFITRFAGIGDAEYQRLEVEPSREREFYDDLDEEEQGKRKCPHVAALRETLSLNLVVRRNEEYEVWCRRTPWALEEYDNPGVPEESPWGHYYMRIAGIDNIIPIGILWLDRDWPHLNEQFLGAEKLFHLGRWPLLTERFHRTLDDAVSAVLAHVRMGYRSKGMWYGSGIRGLDLIEARAWHSARQREKSPAAGDWVIFDGGELGRITHRCHRNAYGWFCEKANPGTRRGGAPDPTIFTAHPGGRAERPDFMFRESQEPPAFEPVDLRELEPAGSRRAVFYVRPKIREDTLRRIEVPTRVWSVRGRRV